MGLPIVLLKQGRTFSTNCFLDDTHEVRFLLSVVFGRCMDTHTAFSALILEVHFKL